MVLRADIAAAILIVGAACKAQEAPANNDAARDPPSIAGAWKCRMQASGPEFREVTLSLLSAGKYSHIMEFDDGKGLVVREEKTGSWEVRDGQFLATIEGGTKQFARAGTVERIAPGALAPMRVVTATSTELKLNGASVDWSCAFGRVK